mgnify:CR=1 FL=1
MFGFTVLTLVLIRKNDSTLAALSLRTLVAKDTKLLAAKVLESQSALLADSPSKNFGMMNPIPEIHEVIIPYFGLKSYQLLGC